MMASYNEEFNQCRAFLENIAKSVVPQDPEVRIKAQYLRNRIITHVDAEGEVIHWILKYLDDKKCPTKLIAPIVRNVLVEIQNDPRYKEPNIDEYPDYRSIATSTLEGFCARLMDNVELNKILDTATSRSVQQSNDDLLPIPIRVEGALQNKRRKMEDRTICIDEFHKVYDVKDAPKCSFYGVFDGHTGYISAQYAASHLPFNFAGYYFASKNPVEAFLNAFDYTDRMFISKRLGSGTTAVCALYRPEENRLIIAWVGDSKALLAKQHGKIMQLVKPHRADSTQERMRIHKTGGSVYFTQGALRVNGCLMITRSIGDIREKQLLISLPDLVVVDLDKQEDFLVLATDGLWDHVSDVDVARFVYDCIEKDCENLDQIPSGLIELALAGKSTDNISIVVLFFKHPSLIAKNCANVNIMESEFDNVKEVNCYSSTNFYPSDGNTTSDLYAIDAKELRWSPNDNRNNIINEEVKQTTTTTTTTTASTTNNGQFDDNLLYSSDNIDLKQKIPQPVGDDNNVHHASTRENNDEEELLAAGFDNKNELSTECDNDQQKILEKNQPHQQLGDTDADYGPETCVDVTDDVVMVTENSADTNNLLEQSTLSHSKDTLPSSDNCNPFDNKNTLDMEDGYEFQLGGGGVDAHLQLDDANKSTPLLSPEVEDLPLSSEGGLQYTNEGFQQSPLDDDIPVEIGSHQQQDEFEVEFMRSNGHLSPIEVKNTEVEKLDITQKTEEQEEVESLAKLERFGDLEEEIVKEETNEILGRIPHQNTDLHEDFFGNIVQPPVAQKMENIFENLDNIDNDDDNGDFRLKDEEEIPEKHVEASFVENELKEPETEVLDFNQRDELQQTLQNQEDDILEEKPILSGSFTEKQITEINFDDLSMHLEEEKLSDFAEEKQDREEFSEKDGKVDEMFGKLSFVEQKSSTSGEIELEEDECIHLEEDVRPSDYLAMLERQKEEHQQLSNVVEGFEKDGQFDEEQKPVEVEKVESLEKKVDLEKDEGISENWETQEKEEPYEQDERLKQTESNDKLLFEGDDRLSDKVEQLAKEHNLEKDEGLSEKEEEHHENFERLPELPEQFDNGKLIEQPAQQYENERFSPQQPEELVIEQLSHQNEKLVEQLSSQDEKLSEQLSHEEEKLTEQLSHEEEKLTEQLSHEEEKLTEQLPHEDEKLKEQVSLGDEKLSEQVQVDELEKEQEQDADKKFDDQVEPISNNERYDLEGSLLSTGTEEVQQSDDDAHRNEPIAQLDEPQKDLQQPEELSVNEFKDDISNQNTNLLQSEETLLVEDSVAQPEKQCFEEPEKLVEEGLPQQEIDNLVLQQEQPSVNEELPVEEPENKLIEDDSFEETEKQLVECTEKQLSKVEQQILDAAAVFGKSEDKKETPIPGFEEEPEELVEVVEEPIIKEQVKIQPNILPVASQEPSVVPPTHESCDESEDDEWKYMKEGQGEKQLFGLQSDIVVEEELQQHLQEEVAGAFSVNEKIQPLATKLTEQVSTDDIESIKDTFESLTQNIAELAESAAAVTETAVDKIGDTLENLNLSQSSTREKLDNIEDDDISASEMNSKLNPEAKEFVPTFSPTATIELANGFGVPTPTAIPPHFKDEVLAQSPRKGRESNMENINIPAENEFEEEIAHKPHGLPNDEAIIEHAENGGLFQEMNWKEAMHGSEKEEGPLVDSPLTEESLEIVDNALPYPPPPNLAELSAPIDLDNAGMKESIYIENNTSQQSNEEDVLNTVQVLPVEDNESKDSSFELMNASLEKMLVAPVDESMPANDAVTKEEVQELLSLAGDEKKENRIDDIGQKMEQLLLSHDKEMTKNVQLDVEQIPINGVEMSPSTPEVSLNESLIPVTESKLVDESQEPSAPVELAASPIPVGEEAIEALSLGAAAAVAVAATTAAVKKVEAEKNQKNLSKTSSAAKSKVPDTKKPAKISAVPSVAAKRSLADKPKPAAPSTLATKKTVGSTTAAPRPRTAPMAVGVKTPTEKKTTATTTSTAKSRIDTKAASTLAARKPLTSSAAKTTTSKLVDDARSSSTIVKSATSSKSVVACKSSTGSAKATSTNSITKPRQAIASPATTNGTATKTLASKPTTLAPKSAITKPSLTSPRGTLTSTLRKTEAIKSPTKTTSSTITSRVNSTNGTKTTSTTRTTTSKTTLSTVPTAAARSTTTTTRRTVTGTTSTIGATTPTSKPINLVPRKSTPLRKTNTSSPSTPTTRKSIGSKLNASATKPTKDTTTPRPVTIPAHHQNNNSIVAEQPKVEPLVVDANSIDGVPKLNGIASPDDVTSPMAPVARSLEMEIA